eukprot:1511380-Rhodomonas_salina.1
MGVGGRGWVLGFEGSKAGGNDSDTSVGALQDDKRALYLTAREREPRRERGREREREICSTCAILLLKHMAGGVEKVFTVWWPR